MAEAHEDMPLELYAAVVAALGEGYSLGEILEQEGLSEDAWEAGEERWIERLGDSSEGDLSLCDELDRALSAQRARFARRVPPLDSDLDAFIVFQRILAAEQVPLAWLKRHGLNLGDWVRLQELWAERLSQDSEVRARAAALLCSPELPELPRIEPAARTWPAPLRERATSTTITTTGEPVAGESIEWGLGPIRGDRPARAPRARPDPSPLNISPEERAEDPPLAARPTFMQDIASLPALSALLAPLVELEGSSAAELTLVPLSPPVPRPALPFAAEDVASVAELTLVPLSSPVPRPALPFSEDPPAPPNVIESDPSDAARTLPPAPLVLAERAVLPFANEASERRRPGRTTSASPGAERTLPPPPLVAEERPHLPFVTSAAAPPATRPSDRLTIEQYAALCAELAVTPAASEEVFLRHGLASLRERLTVDLAWQDRLRRNPTEHQTWAALYERYRAHFALRVKGGSRG